MLIPLPELDLMPRPVRRAVILTFLGWACFLVATYAYYDPNSFFKFAIAGGIICYYLYKSKRWARVIAMLASVFIVFYGGFFTVLYAGRDMVAMTLSAANVALFAAAFVYFLLPEANRYFKQMATTGENSDDRSSRSDTQGDG